MNAQRPLRVMIAGGGTGGHAYPGIALYRALKRRVDDVSVMFVGAKSGVERGIFEGLGLPHVLLPGRGVRGTSWLSRLTSPFVFAAATLGGVREILRFKPDLVIGTGGYASVAVVMGAVLCGQRRVLQEQNSVPGMTNRILSRFAHLMLLSYAGSRKYFRESLHCEVVGNPLRIDITPDRQTAVEFFGLDGTLPTVLIFGGSRGARSINDAARAAAANIVERRDVQFVFLAGERDYERVKSGLGGRERLVRVYPFLEEIQHAYSVADVAVSRAGASSVFELAAFGVPTIFVPYPYAADDHQYENVQELAAAGAVEVVGDSAMNGELLQAVIESLLDDEQKRRAMSSGSKTWARTDAADRGAEEILKLASRSELTRLVPQQV